MIYQPFIFDKYALDLDGSIYIIELSRPLKHARYYVGFTVDVEKRLKQHQTGRGSVICNAARKEGIELKIIATLPGNRTLERLLKNQKNTPRIVSQIKNATYNYPYFYTGVIE